MPLTFCLPHALLLTQNAVLRELPLREGDIVTVFRPARPDGLAEAQVGPRKGFVPISFLEEIQGPHNVPRTRLLGQLVDGTARRSSPATAPAGRRTPGFQPGAAKKMRARLDFDPSETTGSVIAEREQLPFKKGDILYVNSDQSGSRQDGFVVAQGEDGDFGYVPLQFLEDVIEPHDNSRNLSYADTTSDVYVDGWVGGEVGVVDDIQFDTLVLRCQNEWCIGRTLSANVRWLGTTS